MSESLAFKYFPWQYWRPSGVNAEFDPSQANTATQNARALLIGQITSSGTATPNVAVQAYSQTQVNGLCGLNSMLALKYAAYRLMDPFGEVWLGPLADASGGTAATGQHQLHRPGDCRRHAAAVFDGRVDPGCGEQRRHRVNHRDQHGCRDHGLGRCRMLGGDRRHARLPGRSDRAAQGPRAQRHRHPVRLSTARRMARSSRPGWATRSRPLRAARPTRP